MRNSIYLLLVSSALAAFCTAPGRAADLAAAPAPDFAAATAPSGWTFAVAPYLWGAGISGNVEAFGAPSVNVDVGFTDVLDHLDGIPVMLVSEARNGAYDFTRVEADVRQYVSAFAERRVLALRLFASTSTAEPGNDIPFYLMPSLGGHDSLRGFRDYRFRGPHALLAHPLEALLVGVIAA